MAFPWLVLGVLLIVIGIALVPGWWGVLIAALGGASLGIYEIVTRH